MSWASPQIRLCGLTKKLRTCRLCQFKLRTCRCGLFFNFRLQFRKFCTNIDILFCLCKIFVFSQSNIRNQFNIFEFKVGKNIKSFEYRLTKIRSLLFDLIAFFLLACCFWSSAQQSTFFEFKFDLTALVQSMAFVVFYRESTKLFTVVSFFVLVASAVATVGPRGAVPPPKNCLCPPFRFPQNAFLEHHVTTRQQAIMEKGIMT